MTSKHDILKPKYRLSKAHSDHSDGECGIEEDLTIGVAFRCSDGIVLAADRWRKKGDSGTYVTKVRSFKPRKDLIGAMVGAGVSDFIDAAFDRVDEALKDGMTLLEARRAIDRVRRTIYKEDIQPIAEHDEEPRFSFLVALWSRKGGFCLLSGTSRAPASAVHDRNYKAIGKGAPLANCLVKTFYSSDGFWEGSCEEAALISTMTLKLVKDFVEGCEGRTNIIAVMENRLSNPRSSHAVEEAEDCFVGFFEILRQVFSNLTLRQDSDSFYDEQFRLLKSNLQRFAADHCQNPLLVRRFPREEKTRHTSQGQECTRI